VTREKTPKDVGDPVAGVHLRALLEKRHLLSGGMMEERRGVFHPTDRIASGANDTAFY